MYLGQNITIKMKTVVISGGTKGIGKAIVEKFAREGFQIFTCARNEDQLNELSSEIEKEYNIKCNKRMDEKEESFAEMVTSAAKGFIGKYVIDKDVKIEYNGWYDDLKKLCDQ